MFEFLAYRVADVMTRDVKTVTPDTSLAELEALFDAGDFDAVPVVADGHLAGVASKLDVLRAYSFTPDAIVPHYDEIRARPVRSVMTTQPLTVGPDLPLTRVLELLVATRVKSLPVVEGGGVTGIVAREDVLRALRRAAGQGRGRR
jgi:CBS domain-containing protein